MATFVWFGLKSYGESSPVSTYQTQLIQELAALGEPIHWIQISDPKKLSKNKFVNISTVFQNEQWVVLPDNTPLVDFLDNLNNHRVLLHVDFKSAKALPSLRNLLKADDHWKKFIICSRSDGVLTDIRGLEPDWSFCSGEIFLTRMLAFSSLGLQSLVKIKADAFFIHLKNLNLKPNMIPMIQEAQRQNKLVFIGPVDGPLDGFLPDGWVVKK